MILSDRPVLAAGFRPGPLYHNAPFANSMLALFLGNHLVVLPRFDALCTLECLAQYRIHFVALHDG
jgi:bile acid-coenzyme A ligase